MHDVGGILGAVVIGLVAGWVADQVTGRRHGLLTTLVVGLVGSFLGAFIANVLNIAYTGWWASLAISAAGAVVLLVLLGLVRRRV
jgi:uncharacterized membrane protein YeaQ/YmgE (transglycosylase-associated protein family)